LTLAPVFRLSCSLVALMAPTLGPVSGFAAACLVTLGGWQLQTHEDIALVTPAAFPEAAELVIDSPSGFLETLEVDGLISAVRSFWPWSWQITMGVAALLDLALVAVVGLWLQRRRSTTIDCSVEEALTAAADRAQPQQEEPLPSAADRVQKDEQNDAEIVVIGTGYCVQKDGQIVATPPKGASPGTADSPVLKLHAEDGSPIKRLSGEHTAATTPDPVQRVPSPSRSGSSRLVGQID